MYFGKQCEPTKKEGKEAPKYRAPDSEWGVREREQCRSKEDARVFPGVDSSTQ